MTMILPTVRCNRCRKGLTVEASRIKGIGPICERKGLRALGGLVNQPIPLNRSQEFFDAFSKIEIALHNDFEGSLDYGNVHRDKIIALLSQEADHAEMLGFAYEVLADVCNQLPGSYEVADAAKFFFFVVGAPEEGEVAYKRLSRIIKKAGSSVF